MRTTSDVEDTATHTASAAIARPLGSSPTGMTARTLPVEGSSRATVPSRVLATHTASAEATTAAGPLPTRIGAAAAPLSLASRVTVPAPKSVTHTAPGLL